tara:strand:- start:1165 stop:1338 length:174 start_codon:yes stop_codon:yes gene_type:complete
MAPHLMMKAPRIFSEEEIIAPFGIRQLSGFFWPHDASLTTVMKLLLLTLFTTIWAID